MSDHNENPIPPHIDGQIREFLQENAPPDADHAHVLRLKVDASGPTVLGTACYGKAEVTYEAKGHATVGGPNEAYAQGWARIFGDSSTVN